MISLWKLREKKNVAQMPFVKNTPALVKMGHNQLAAIPDIASGGSF